MLMITHQDSKSRRMGGLRSAPRTHQSATKKPDHPGCLQYTRKNKNQLPKPNTSATPCQHIQSRKRAQELHWKNYATPQNRHQGTEKNEISIQTYSSPWLYNLCIAQSKFSSRQGGLRERVEAEVEPREGREIWMNNGWTHPSFMTIFVGTVCRHRQRLCINFSVSIVNSLTTLRSHLNVSCYFWSNLFNVDVNYSYMLIIYCSDYLKCIGKDLVNYTYFDSCWLFKFWIFGW